MNRNIKKIALHLIKKYNTQNPFKIADDLKIEYIIGPMGQYSGCYLYLKRHRCIFINEDLPENDRHFVMAHELGHALLHRKENCYFIRNKTLLSTSRIEKEANTFAAELLIPDSLIYENSGMTKNQLARLAGYNEKILDFKKLINSPRAF